MAVVGASGATSAAEGRCAAHPSRPAHERCPTCGRPRCARDAGLGGHCALCAPGAAPTDARSPLAALVATAVAGTLLATTGAAIGQEYVGAQVFSVLLPALVGVVIAATAAALVGSPPTPVRHAVAVLCGAYAGISALLDFRFTDLPFGPTGRWLPPLAAAVVAGAVAAEVLVRRRRAARRAQPRNSISAIPPR